MQFIYLAVTVALTNYAVAQSVATGMLGNATVVEDNPPGVTYTASLPSMNLSSQNNSRSNIMGSVTATANPDGIGVMFNVSFSNLPTTGGPFAYHLHVAPVPSDGNCTGTLGHLDPFIRGEELACNMSLPQTCQVGDLSGKHGKITSDPFKASYSEEFASTTTGLGSFFGNRSIVVHSSDKTRIACANFTLAGAVGDEMSNTTNGTYGNSTDGNGTDNTSPIQFEGNANQIGITYVIALTTLIHLALMA
ncbi:BgTH12-05575 [Blumeria graminis f. sp. triticale]|uniref:superoxide dismutase n=3 Tax=Blumeria graminis TaxID=34373 RepID=A0A9X9MKZ6_BLUGR|nr:BgTH12-05575 [Blumeria graminis f. sp. triticale]VDB90483.1 BgtASP-20811 [Blumeria graminis f. sp. tritici]